MIPIMDRRLLYRTIEQFTMILRDNKHSWEKRLQGMQVGIIKANFTIIKSQALKSLSRSIIRQLITRITFLRESCNKPFPKHVTDLSPTHSFNSLLLKQKSRKIKTLNSTLIKQINLTLVILKGQMLVAMSMRSTRR